jgi:hypothetical protein
MKKLLLIVLLGFVLISILAVMFTFQSSNTFNFEENGDNGDDHVIPNDVESIDTTIDPSNEKKSLSYILEELWPQSLILLIYDIDTINNII